MKQVFGQQTRHTILKQTILPLQGALCICCIKPNASLRFALGQDMQGLQPKDTFKLKDKRKEDDLWKQPRLSNDSNFILSPKAIFKSAINRYLVYVPIRLIRENQRSIQGVLKNSYNLLLFMVRCSAPSGCRGIGLLPIGRCSAPF